MFENLKEIKHFKWILMAGMGFLVAIGAFFLSQEKPEAESQFPVLATEVTESSPQEEESQNTKTNEPSKSGTIWVDIKGEVTRPGLYELEGKARIHDAVEAAGGLTKQADPKSINLAQKLADEAIVYVAKQGEEISVVQAQAVASQGETASDQTGKINLNTATASDLQTISGIGEKRANDIIAYRDSQGGFQAVDDLNQVSGIGDKTLENIRPYVTVE